MLFKIPRINAFLVHFSISFVIFLILTYLIVFHWYPLPYFHTDGGWRGIRIIAGVDLVIGPLLTLIVYKPGKPGLKLDLTLIGLVQAAALTWGVWVTYIERPVAIVYALKYFTPVSAKLLTKAEFSLEQLSTIENKTPVPVYVDIPQDRDQQQKLLAQALGSGRPLYLFTELYRNFDSESLQVLKHNSDQLYKYLESDDKGKQLLEKFYLIHPELYNRYLFIPLHSRYTQQVIILDAINLNYIGNLNINVTNFVLGLPKQQPAKVQKVPNN